MLSGCIGLWFKKTCLSTSCHGMNVRGWRGIECRSKNKRPRDLCRRRCSWDNQGGGGGVEQMRESMSRSSSESGCDRRQGRRL